MREQAGDGYGAAGNAGPGGMPPHVQQHLMRMRGMADEMGPGFDAEGGMGYEQLSALADRIGNVSREHLPSACSAMSLFSMRTEAEGGLRCMCACVILREQLPANLDRIGDV